MTSLMVNENLRSRSEAATSTTNFLDSQLKDAKQAVDDQDAKLAAFKKQYLASCRRTSITTCACWGR